MHMRVFLRKLAYGTRLAIYNTRVCPKYVTICIATRLYLLDMRLMSLQLAYSCQKYVCLSLGSLGGYATNSFSCNYFVFDPISSETYK